MDPTAATTGLTTVTYPPGMEAQAKAVADAVPGASVAASSAVDQVTLTLGSDGVRVPTAASSSAAPSSSSSSSASTTSAPKSFSSASCVN
ncbi:hypothetical protein GGQ55_002662 [Geodermatophilus daqingensis]|uniref:LytR/CpsA/Psr regulator C-terminal domain-containing protein n=1 Tax=Petropleomorpha daqingensis TaxID=2026353 RepID=A0A853CET9_9ACTN|nr:hypothetical protein [Petropleomorpha daqingensis]